MKPMHVNIRWIGNSQGVVIPKPVLKQLGLSAEAGVEMIIERDALILRTGFNQYRALGLGRGGREDSGGWRRRPRDGRIRQCRRHETHVVRRGEIWLVSLDPTVGGEIRKSRPCVVVSPAEMHDYLRTVFVAPMTTKSRPAPFRVGVTYSGQKGLILLDQMRAVDKIRLAKGWALYRQRRSPGC